MEPATHSPSAEPRPEGDPQPRLRRVGRRLLPRSLQARLTLGFVAIVSLTLALVGGLALNRLDDYFAIQEEQNLKSRATAVAYILRVSIEREIGSDAVVAPGNLVAGRVAALLENDRFMTALATIGGADLVVRIGSTSVDPVTSKPALDAGSAGPWSARYQGSPLVGQARQAIARSYLIPTDDTDSPWAMEITLANPYTYRATTIADLTYVLALVGLLALGVALVLAAILARRFTTSIRRLGETSAVIAGGDLSARVPVAADAPLEIASLSRQFNRMAGQLEESIEIIRRDRDRSRDFLADVSHELRTPIAALRTFNELLQEGAADDAATRAEFLESSGGQIERLDWLAQNLLELSKLDSGLVLLDLRPEDLRSAVESAVEQAEALAGRRGIDLACSLPREPLRIRHDPQRIAQVVANLIGNALKFTARGGRVEVELARDGDGARIRVSDTGIGIDPAELPLIFDRFYRGSRSNEARGSGSGLGLAIAKSIVDMHEGRIVVESRLGEGSTFSVLLPADPRAAGDGTGP